MYLAQRFGLKAGHGAANYAGLLSDDTSTESSNESEEFDANGTLNTQDQDFLQELSETTSNPQIVQRPGASSPKVDISSPKVSLSQSLVQLGKKFVEDKQKNVNQQLSSVPKKKAELP